MERLGPVGSRTIETFKEAYWKLLPHRQCSPGMRATMSLSAAVEEVLATKLSYVVVLVDEDREEESVGVLKMFSGHVGLVFPWADDPADWMPSERKLVAARRSWIHRRSSVNVITTGDFFAPNGCLLRGNLVDHAYNAAVIWVAAEVPPPPAWFQMFPLVLLPQLGRTPAADL